MPAQEMFNLATINAPLRMLRIQAWLRSSPQAPKGQADSPLTLINQIDCKAGQTSLKAEHVIRITCASLSFTPEYVFDNLLTNNGNWTEWNTTNHGVIGRVSSKSADRALVLISLSITRVEDRKSKRN